MRVLFCSGGGPPHLFPVVPLAWALRAAGHEVRLTGPPSSRDDLARTGLPAATVGTGPQLSTTDREGLVRQAYGQKPWPADWPAALHLLDQRQVGYLELLGRYVVAVAEGMVDELVALARQWQPDLIVWDGLALGGAVAAAVLGVPSVRLFYGVQSVPRVEMGAADRDPLPECVRLFARFGVKVRVDEATNIST